MPGGTAMPDDRTTLGDLDLAPDAEVLKPTASGNRLHLPDVDCRVVAASDSRIKPVPVASLWDDTPICAYCLDRVEWGGPGGWTPPTPARRAQR